MSKVKTLVSNDPVASTLTSIADQIQSPLLTKSERRKLQGRNERTPDLLVEMLCHLAEQNGGQILGMSFDAATARATLAQASIAQTRINVARQLLQRMEDDLVQQRATVADPSFAVFTALRRLVNTKAGNSLSTAYGQMKAIVKDRPRRSRAKKTTATATTPAPVAVAAPQTSTVAPVVKTVASMSN